MTDYHSDLAFLRLCDLVASDRLVCVTGAGISTGLQRDDDQPLPSWWTLLDELRTELAPQIDAAGHRTDIEELLDGDPATCRAPATGRELILAASLIRAADPATFDLRFRDLVRPKADTTTDSHLELARLRPRGILTFNYDPAHEVADQQARESPAPARAVLVPEQEDELRSHLAANLATPFLLKAHGDLEAGTDAPLTLTADDYRELMVRRPSYRAFVQHLLTEFHLLVVGFGLSDPDFDVFANTIVDAYGRPVRDGVAIFRRGSVPMTRAELRMRLGLEVLEVDEFAEIPDVLADAGRHAGPELQATVESCLAPTMQARVAAHGALRKLGPSGRALARHELTKRLDAERNEPFRHSEVAFSLGYLADLMDRAVEQRERSEIKETLMGLVDDATTGTDTKARALTVLRGLLSPPDQPRIDEWVRRFHPQPGTPEHRLAAYAGYLQEFIPAKFGSDPAP